MNCIGNFFIRNLRSYLLSSSKKGLIFCSLLDGFVLIVITIFLMAIYAHKGILTLIINMLFFEEKFVLLFVSWFGVTGAWRGGKDFQILLSKHRSVYKLMLEGFISGLFFIIVFELIYLIPFFLAQLGIPINYETKLLAENDWLHNFFYSLLFAIMSGAMGACLGLIIALLNRHFARWLHGFPECRERR